MALENYGETDGGGEVEYTGESTPRAVPHAPATTEGPRMAPIDPTKPWWRQREYVNTFGSAGQTDGLAAEFYTHCIREALTLHYFGRSGDLVGCNPEAFYDEAQKLGGHMLYCDEAFKDRTTRIYLFDWGMFQFHASENDGEWHGTMEMYSTDKDVIVRFGVLAKQHLVRRPSEGRMYVLVSSQGGLQLHSIGKAGRQLVDTNYSAKALEGYNHIIRDLKSEHPTGRIAIFSGTPGTGKTYMIRGLLQDVSNGIFVLVPANLVAALAQPDAINVLIAERARHRHNEGIAPLILVIEDADECLAKRDGMNTSAVSALLNLSDGILGSSLDLRIVATTNLKHVELDEAVERPGRLSQYVEVDALSYDEAIAAFQAMGGDVAKLDLGRKYTIAELYQLKRPPRPELRPKKNDRRVGFA